MSVEKDRIHKLIENCKFNTARFIFSYSATPALYELLAFFKYQEEIFPLNLNYTKGIKYCLNILKYEYLLNDIRNRTDILVRENIKAGKGKYGFSGKKTDLLKSCWTEYENLLEEKSAMIKNRDEQIEMLYSSFDFQK